jgi:hypothetical protein
MATALSALLGVAVGQFLQGRRENIRWARERELEDERREEQRQRDRELWTREDRNRFIDKVREAYVDYQNSAYVLSAYFFNTVREVDEADTGEIEREDLLAERDFSGRFTDLNNQLKIVRTRLRLLAPPEVLSAVTNIDEILMPSIEVFMTSSDAARQLWTSLRSARFDLFNAMRSDLDPRMPPLATDQTSGFVDETVK